MTDAKGPPFCTNSHDHQPTRDDALTDEFKKDRRCEKCRAGE
jgi:hypothetical protein